MELIYRIRIRTEAGRHDAYPSERRYSSTMICGIGVIFFALAMHAIVLGTLIIYKSLVISSSGDADPRLVRNVERDTPSTNLATPLAVTCFIMAIGCTAAGITAFSAWKYWYVDGNIGWCLLTSIISILTSVACLLASILELIEHGILTFGPALLADIFIECFLVLLWSTIATVVSYRGLRNDYNDDNSKDIPHIVVTKGSLGKMPPDILRHFPVADEQHDCYREKVTKYLEEQDNSK